MQILSSQKITYLQESLLVSTGLFYCELDADLTLSGTNCSMSDEIFTLFHHCSSSLKKIIASESWRPLLLSDELGLTWNVAFEVSETSNCHIHILGPSFICHPTDAQITNSLQGQTFSYAYQCAFQKLYNHIPTTPHASFLQYGIMLNYAVSQRRYTTADYQYQSFAAEHPLPSDMDNTDFDTCFNIYSAEQNALKMVEQGCLQYQRAFDALSLFSDALPDPIAYTVSRQQKNAVLSFLTLVTRSAIKGGLDPKTAYHIGGYYSNNIENAHTFSDLLHLNALMYDDFIHRVHKVRTNQQVSASIQSCCNYIDLHLDQKLTLHDLASLTGYAEAYLSQKFKKEMHMNIRQYINQSRITQAKILLHSTRKSVAEIGDDLGFYNSSHFIETFRRSTGTTPEQYRKKGCRPALPQ